MAKQSKATKSATKGSAKKKTTKKTTARKKPAGQKKSGGKKAAGKASAKPAARAKRQPHSPERLETQVAVWEAYARLRSMRAVAREMSVGEWVVREVVSADQDKLRATVHSYLEDLAANWEAKGQRAHQLMERLLDLVDNMLAEIHQAAAEGRMTVIRDQDGNPLPVLDAIQLIVATKTLDQMNRIAQQATTISMNYRQGVAQGTPDGDGGGSGGGQRFETMTDQQLAELIRQGGHKVPALLERKVKLIAGGGEETPADAGTPAGEQEGEK